MTGSSNLNKNPRSHLYDLIEPADVEHNLCIHNCRFNGNGSEYFYIWIANLALTIVTFGIYGAWAKVRREQYFCSHTVLDDHTFEYTAVPINILKGRIFVLILIGLLITVTSFFPIVNLFLVPLAVMVFPWIITQALKFRARYTSYRNIPLRFRGSYDQTLKYYVISRLIAYITGSLMTPWAKFKERRYLVENIAYGKTKMEFNGCMGSFYKIYFSINAILVLPLLVAFLALLYPVAESALSDLQQISFTNLDATWFLLSNQPRLLLIVIIGAAMVVSWQIIAPIFIRFLVSQLTWDGAIIGDFEVFYRPAFTRFVWIAVTNILLIIVTFGMATPFCVVRMRKFKIENFALLGRDALDQFQAGDREHAGSFGDQAIDLYGLDIDVGF